MQKIVDYTLIILSLVIAIIFFLYFDLENILWNFEKHDVVDMSKIKEDRVTNYTGLTAGKDIPSIKTKEEWEQVFNDTSYVTVIPKSIIKTDVYSLAKWVPQYTRWYNGTTSRKLSQVKQTSFDISANYSPYYIIELEDGSHILAQMNRGIARKIEKGEKVQLPIGKKIGFLQGAKNKLSAICQEVGASTDYVLYTINDDWEKEHVNIILCGKILVSIIIFFILAVTLQLVVDKLLFDSKKKN